MCSIRQFGQNWNLLVPCATSALLLFVYRARYQVRRGDQKKMSLSAAETKKPRSSLLGGFRDSEGMAHHWLETITSPNWADFREGYSLGHFGSCDKHLVAQGAVNVESAERCVKGHFDSTPE